MTIPPFHLLRSETVRFDGLRSGSAPLSWGQHAIWKSIQWLGKDDHYFNIPRALLVPPGHTTGQVVEVVAHLIRRHEALRATFADGPQGPVQTVYGDGEVRVEIRETPQSLSHEQALDQAQQLADVSFAHADEFGMRYAVVESGGAPAWLLLVVSHQSTDFFGIRVLERELSDLFAGKRLPPVDWFPLDQARFQQDEDGAARGRASLDYWRRQLSRVPRSHLDFPQGADGAQDDPERFVRLRLDSPAGAVAAEALATRCEVSTGTVLLTAAAVVIAAYSGHDTAVLQLISGNRNEPRLRDMLGAQTENALFVLGLSGGTFEDAIRRCFLPSMSAYRYGEYHPPSMDRVHAEVQRERGVALDLSSFFNDVRMKDRWENLPDTDGSAEQLRELAARSTVSFIGAWPRQDAKYFVHVTYAPDTLHLYLMADTAYLPRPLIERLLLAMEALLVNSVHGTVDVREATGADRAERPAGWSFLDACWFDRDAVAALVSEAAGGTATVEPVEDEDGRTRLVAEVVVRDGAGGAPGTGAASAPDAVAGSEQTPAAVADPVVLHEAVVAALAGRTDVVAPHHYRIRSVSGELLAEGTGRP